MDETRPRSVTVTGNVTRDEYEAARAAGPYRRVRVTGCAVAALLVTVGLLLPAAGGSPEPVPLGIAAVYLALVLCGPPLLAARPLRAQQARGVKTSTMDAGGITVRIGGVPGSTRIAWGDIGRHHETGRLHVLVGRSGRRTCLLALPERLLPGPEGEALLAAFLAARFARTP